MLVLKSISVELSGIATARVKLALSNGVIRAETEKGMARANTEMNADFPEMATKHLLLWFNDYRTREN